MKYTETHEWVTLDGDVATVGITDAAQKELGEIVYVELPKTGHKAEAGQEIAVLESTKAAVDLYSPLTGEVTEVNTSLSTSPNHINSSPHTDGWLFRLKLADPTTFHTLLDQEPR